MLPSTMTPPQRLTDRTMCLEEGGYVFRNILDEDSRVKAYRLRHRVFAEDLQWVPRTESELEVDAYDAQAVHFGVFDAAGKLLAYVRLLTADQTFMVEKEFQCVIGDAHRVSKERDTCELTRFCVAPGTRNEVVTRKREVFSITALLFKGVYRWCAERDIRFIYGVTDRPIHKYLTMRGYPYERIGNPKRMPDGVVAIAVRLDWREFESLNSIKRPRLLEWYAQKSMSLLPRATAMA